MKKFIAEFLKKNSYLAPAYITAFVVGSALGLFELGLMLAHYHIIEEKIVYEVVGYFVVAFYVTILAAIAII